MNCFPFFADISPDAHAHQLSLFKQGQDISYHVTKRKRKDGKILTILASYRSVNDGEVLAVGMYKDFTEQMILQRRLQASEGCYCNLVEFIPNAIFVENNGEIVFVNSSGIELINAPMQQKCLANQFGSLLKKTIKQNFSRK